ncbi:MAG: CBS domain-containing protein, partial [Burkholderiaceae bacterium]|nr:CBS domain-containing protein [Burkholderiaceae bacterium]
ILAGSSTGTLLAAALRYCRAQTTPKRVVTFVCDTGTRYLSKVYNDHWMFEQGLLTRPRIGDLRDLIARPAASGGVVSVAPADTLKTAFSRMRQADVSQLPVLAEGRLVGLLDESDLLARLHADATAFSTPVSAAMSADVITLAPQAPLAELAEQLRRGLVAVIADDSGFHGLVTRVDLINHLRKEVAA